MTKEKDILYETPNKSCWDQLQREVIIFLLVWS